MGAMPFSELFKIRKSRVADPAEAVADAVDAVVPAALVDHEKLALVEQLEASGASLFWSTDVAGRIAYISPSIPELLGASAESLVGDPFQAHFAPADGEADGRSLGLKLAARKPFSNLTVACARDSVDLVLRLSGRPHFDPEGEFLGFRGTGLDVTAEFRGEAEAARLAKFDSLTGLANRHRMEQRIDSTLAAFRAAKRQTAILMLDLDRFKQVNDTLGHAAGDQLLQQVAERLQAVVAGRGEIGRLGGDEFQLLIPDMADRGELGELAKRIIAMISQPYSVEEGRCTIGCSVGIAIAPYDGVERDELTRAADLALYASKNGGRGQFRFYAADLEHEARLRKRMEEDLAQALEGGRFSLEYQPLATLEDNRVVGLEAQYVWEDEERGRVGPETFLPVAEGSRLIVPLGEWALRRACADALGWPDSLRVAVNVSPVQFFAAGFAAMVAEVIEQSGLDPARLELELRESILQGDPGAVDTTLSALFKLGVRLTLDEFGTGFTSLGYLRRAPFTAVKIGAGFFETSVRHEHGDMGMVRAIVALAGALGMETHATGVHSPALLEELRTLGVAGAQGFVFAEALPAAQVLEEIASGEWRLAPSDSGNQRASRRTVFRKVGVIHEGHYYEVTLRNLSRSGAMIQGLCDVPVGTEFVLDFAQGQLAVCTVMRAMDDTQGVEFEEPLVDDGAGGLCTRERASPYEIAAAGAPLPALPPTRAAGGEAKRSYPRFKLANGSAAQPLRKD
ncbi:MAG: EAL domain-containing protein [Alphaproteobacteria bacterium]|nr:EAL domain-containing protein [Alphaproteobacteria bacterium]